MPQKTLPSRYYTGKMIREIKKLGYKNFPKAKIILDEIKLGMKAPRNQQGYKRRMVFNGTVYNIHAHTSLLVGEIYEYSSSAAFVNIRMGDTSIMSFPPVRRTDLFLKRFTGLCETAKALIEERPLCPHAGCHASMKITPIYNNDDRLVNIHYVCRKKKAHKNGQPVIIEAISYLKKKGKLTNLGLDYLDNVFLKRNYYLNRLEKMPIDEKPESIRNIRKRWKIEHPGNVE